MPPWPSGLTKRGPLRAARARRCWGAAGACGGSQPPGSSGMPPIVASGTSGPPALVGGACCRWRSRRRPSTRLRGRTPLREVEGSERRARAGGAGRLGRGVRGPVRAALAAGVPGGVARRARRGGRRGHRAGGVHRRARRARPLRPPAAVRAVAEPDRRQPRDRPCPLAAAARGADGGRSPPPRRPRRRAGRRRSCARSPSCRSTSARSSSCATRSATRRARSRARWGCRAAPSTRACAARSTGSGSCSMEPDRLRDVVAPDEDGARERACAAARGVDARTRGRSERPSAASRRAGGRPPPRPPRGRLGWRSPPRRSRSSPRSPRRRGGRRLGPERGRAAAADSPPAARPRADRPPSGGRLLVSSGGRIWIVEANGKRRRLGAWDGAAWSPHGRFVIAWRGRRLAALDPRGKVRWSLQAPRPVQQALWSPSGFRVAYRSGGDLRVVAGDGSGDRELGRASFSPLAWRPGRAHVLAHISGRHLDVRRRRLRPPARADPAPARRRPDRLVGRRHAPVRQPPPLDRRLRRPRPPHRPDPDAAPLDGHDVRPRPRRLARRGGAARARRRARSR